MKMVILVPQLVHTQTKDLSEIKLTNIKGHIFERDILFSKKFSDFKKIQEHKNYIIIALKWL